MVAGKYSFEILQGATFSRIFQWLTDENIPIPLTGYTARLQIRERKEYPAILLSLTSATGEGLIIDETEGKIKMDISAAKTKTLDFIDAVYDLEIEKTSTGIVTRLLEGSVSLNKEVTR